VEVEPEPGVYDFARLEARLEALAAAGLQATVQINANTHPEWLLAAVPTLAEPLRRTRGQQRTPMYWHPVYLEAQQRLVQALADWIAASPNAKNVSAVRLNINAIGTEHWQVPREHRAAAAWETPAGVTAGTDWTRQRGVDYLVDITESYLAAFPGKPVLLVRRGLLHPDGDLQTTARGRDLAARLSRLLNTGQIGLFHTSSEIQPRSAHYSTTAYRTMHHWCRERRALCYAESWTGASKRLTEYPTTPPSSPGQWFYWRVLSDLHLGVSMVAAYGEDLLRADEAGFREGMGLAGRYAGYQRTPAASPGAWIAFRSGDYLPGDYTFLARRLGDCGQPLTGAGPEGSHEGLWATRLGPGEACLLAFDDAFLDGHRGETMTLDITLLGSAPPAELAVSGLLESVMPVPENDAWQRMSFSLEVSGDAERLRIEARGAPLVLHRVTLREPTVPAS
jgi:hypothetical protein